MTLSASALLGLVLSMHNETATAIVTARAVLVGFVAMLTFGLFEQWPARLPAWLPRWTLQLVGVVLVVPFAGVLAYWVTLGGDPQFAQNQKRMVGYGMLTFAGILFAPWIALGAMVRQRDAFARHQALAFELERSELERKALDARLRLLQAQVEPHFLFNTLANVQALVDAGSPQASQVLESLIAYLRAAVPRLNDPATTLGQEAAPGARLPRGDADAHAGSPAVHAAHRRRCRELALPADDASDARRKRRSPRH